MDELKTFTALELARLMCKAGSRRWNLPALRWTLSKRKPGNKRRNHVSEERALEQARRVERRLLEGQEVSPWRSANFNKGQYYGSVRMTCASRMLENYVAPMTPA